jgi:hypothetical protein
MHFITKLYRFIKFIFHKFDDLFMKVTKKANNLAIFVLLLHAFTIFLQNISKATNYQNTLRIDSIYFFSFIDSS